MYSCYSPSAEESYRDIEKITGNWSSRKGVSFNENWQKKENYFSGLGFSLNENDTSFKEILKIHILNDSLTYTVFLGEERVVDFKLHEAGKNYWKFVNPVNDFPSIIEYELENDSLLNIKVSNIRGKKSQYFWLKRSLR